MTRLKETYQTDLMPALTKEFGYTSPMEVPRLEKIVLSKIKFDLHPPTPLFFMETLATHKMNLCRFDTVLLDCVE